MSMSKNTTRSSHLTQKPMTKTQLVAALAEATGSDKKTADANLAALTAIITQEVAAGGAVTLPGLGKFACRARPERMVRNPATGEQMHKDADRVAKVTIAKALKDVINA
jgi:DNA-binding protein HU-beta